MDHLTLYKRIAAKQAAGPTTTAHIHAEGFSETAFDSEFGCRRFRIDEDCPDPLGEYDEFCKKNLYMRRVERVNDLIYVRLRGQSLVHAHAAMFAMNIEKTHNGVNPLAHRVEGMVGGHILLGDIELVPDFSLQPRGANLGPTVVGEIQFSTALSMAHNSESNILGCDVKAGIYLRTFPHISAFICVDIEYPWPANGYPRIILYYFSLPDPTPAFPLMQPSRVVNIGRELTATERAAMIAQYSNVNAGNTFGNGFGGGECHPAADPAHFVFDIPGPTVLYVDADHTVGSDGLDIGAVPANIQVDCRVLLSRILRGAQMENYPIAFGTHWPWEPTDFTLK